MKIIVKNKIIDHYLDSEEYITNFFKEFNTNSTISIWIPKTNRNKDIFNGCMNGEITFSIFPYTCYYEIAGGNREDIYLLCSVDMVEYNRDKKLSQLGF